MFPVALPILGAVSANTALVGGAATVVTVGVAAEYKYKAPSRAIAYVYNSLPTIYKSREQIEKDKEYAQRVLIEGAFDDLMRFRQKSVQEIHSYVAVIRAELDGRINKDNSDADQYNSYSVFFKLSADIIAFKDIYSNALKIAVSDYDHKNMLTINPMLKAEQEIVRRISDIKASTMEYYNYGMEKRLLAINELGNEEKETPKTFFKR